jgi:hypothetical protein
MSAKPRKMLKRSRTCHNSKGSLFWGSAPRPALLCRAFFSSPYGLRKNLRASLRSYFTRRPALGGRVFPGGWNVWVRRFLECKINVVRGSRMPNAECRMPNAECRMPNAECRMPNAVGCWPLAVRQQPTANSQQPSANHVCPASQHPRPRTTSPLKTPVRRAPVIGHNGAQLRPMIFS